MEAARLTAGIVLGGFSGEKLDITELFPFPWENENGSIGEGYQADPEEFKRKAKAWGLL